MPTTAKPLRFAPQCRAADVNLKATIKAFTRHLEAEEHRLGLRSRERRETDRRNFRLAVEALACNLLITAMVAPNATLSVPRGHGAMWGKGRYHNPVYGQHFLAILDLLTKLKLVLRVTKGFRFSQRSRQPTTIRSMPRLARHLPLGATEWNAFCREEDPEVILLKSAKGDGERAEPIEYRDTRNTKQWRRQMKAINRWLKAAPIAVVNDGRAVHLDRDGQPVDPHRRMLVRIFNNKDWEQGGRLFGAHWLTMERADRFRLLRIAGEPVVNVDYMQLFPRLAYARAQAEQPEGDLYDVTGDGSCRDGWKQLINALLFVRKALKQWPEDTREHFPDGTTVKAAVEAIKRKHAPIADWFERGIGFRLMRIESDMLVRIVTALFENGITALPLHDAVLVAQSHAETAREFMQAEFTFRTGSSCGIVKVDVMPI